ncbi:beta strand repeat-containing protein [Defluviicoccus vanus]|uniref:Calcium-binding protein n=1 Tax=Defluviicoccus vanus TaxID=111831 RepID=A0A7H1N0E3_9PROT|nr:calcium-binding protein [Defluviicoccus vanus]QNT69179.1 calcium-binding protein [Defluviicoccus vanus]
MGQCDRTGGIETLAGGLGNDTIFGAEGADLLRGDAGNDSLDGGAGIDTLVGGAGNDTYVVDSSSDVISELAGGGIDTVQSSVTFSLAPVALANVENLTLSGTAAINASGSAANNVLTGNAGNNVLNGGAGIDTLIGGAGDDTYVVDTTTDMITEVAGGGIDTVQSSVTFSLAAFGNIENLTLTATAAVNGTGNALANTLIGNAANNLLTGLDGNDTLNGGAGIDTLVGGAGNDTYVVDTTTDTITEVAGGGIDTVQSSVTFSLAGIAEVENLTLTGTAAINATGNALANSLTGNAASNLLSGLGGNDTLNGGAGIDTLVGGAGGDVYVVDSTSDTITEAAGGGIDTVQSSVTFSLAGIAEVENLTLTGTGAINGTGNALANTLTGNAASNRLTGLDGNDTLNGGAGVDTLVGGAGNDVYVAESTTDTIIEAAGGGIDTVQSSVTFSLAGIAEVENLTLTGTAAVNGTGSALANTLTGNAAANLLSGLDGNDSLVGGAGSDTLDGGIGNDTLFGGSDADLLTGGAGADSFVFRALTDFPASPARDTITAFDGIGATAGDVIDLSAIDANSSVAGDQAFAFIGTSAFVVGQAGGLHAIVSGTDTLIQGEITGDGIADFEFLVKGADATKWAATDFVL